MWPRLLEKLTRSRMKKMASGFQVETWPVDMDWDWEFNKKKSKIVTLPKMYLQRLVKYNE